MASKTAATNGTHRKGPVRKTAGAKRPVRRRESWKKVLERNLILEGISPAEAKELVALAAE
jgi:hypothetical protein